MVYPTSVHLPHITATTPFRLCRWKNGPRWPLPPRTVEIGVWRVYQGWLFDFSIFFILWGYVIIYSQDLRRQSFAVHLVVLFAGQRNFQKGRFLDHQFSVPWHLQHTCWAYRRRSALRFMIYIAIGHAFDAVEGSLLENYGSPVAIGEARWKHETTEIQLSWKRSNGNGSTDAQHHFWMLRPCRARGNNPNLEFFFKYDINWYYILLVHVLGIFGYIHCLNFFEFLWPTMTHTPWPLLQHRRRSGYNASLTSWTAMACAITSILSILTDQVAANWFRAETTAATTTTTTTKTNITYNNNHKTGWSFDSHHFI